MRRLRVAFEVLRGRGVMYRCLVAVDGYGDAFYVASQTGRVTVEQNGFTRVIGGSGEAICFDYRTGMVYPIQIDGRLPR